MNRIKCYFTIFLLQVDFTVYLCRLFIHSVCYCSAQELFYRFGVDKWVPFLIDSFVLVISAASIQYSMTWTLLTNLKYNYTSFKNTDVTVRFVPTSLEYRYGNEDCLHMRHVLCTSNIVTRRDVRFSRYYCTVTKWSICIFIRPSDVINS